MSSPFLNPGHTAQADSLAVLHLRRDLLVPVILKAHDDDDQGYEEGRVTNTRFGSFPHSTLIGQPWGSQIIASRVDTGSRGRKGKKNKGDKDGGASLKRKADEIDTSEVNDETTAKAVPKAAVAASSGFIHLLPPTPESWTSSLPHRTQVVYTPDYSYILHRLRVRPGSTIIEAGAGSGSFTHAAARAVFSGYPSDSHIPKKRRLGKVCSFEFHAQRAEKVKEEIRDHGLEGIVEVNHRDVYNGGFLLRRSASDDDDEPKSPHANAIFLDLPAPWLALDHLVRSPAADGSESPLDPSSPVYICTFSPCLEQVEKTVSALRRHNWLNIEMVEVAHRRLEVRREKYGVESDAAPRGSIPGPRNVEEAVSRQRANEERIQAFHAAQRAKEEERAGESGVEGVEGNDTPMLDSESVQPSVREGTAPSSSLSENPLPAFRQGRLIHRPESELKTHTSYLVFAILPAAWSEADEQRCRERWPSKAESTADAGAEKKTKKQLRQEAKAAEREYKAKAQERELKQEAPAE
ncbi:hypothetical protein AJ80_07693 [Polytolypa hystricis UAMH7299]|uniref:tRNA (adenine(58)-N(1))-methyltransferase catalytic subunit TRM61 n=1 Tax=Polytolypa hystricis (strain UAMH7299) TaxID=1447883 RepID=A0A2B7XLE5_POLH7|nr:hypothetical protein AJ80_07693 [Polytolypa hystricis UAMH7299]